MPSAWTEHGPIALPPRPLAFGVGAALVLLAFVGVGMGVHAAWKDTGLPSLGVGTLASADSADTLVAQPIVDLPAATNTAAPTAANASASNADAEIEAKTERAQQVQSTAAQSGADIDQILASPTEKPTAPAKAPPAEAPPGPPVKSDVPF